MDPTLAIALGAVVIVALLVATAYNHLVRSRNRVREAWSGIDVQLKRRAGLIPNLVETVQGYAAHERGTLGEVAQARGALLRAGGPAAAGPANDALTQALGRLFAVAESYPALRASETFVSLQRELSDVEDKIAFARQFYNRNVLDYNSRIQTFPTVFVAKSFGFDATEFFEASEDGRTDVPVRFVPPGGSTTAPPGPPLARPDS